MARISPKPLNAGGLVVRKRTEKQMRFVDLIGIGRLGHVEAYRQAFDRPELRPKDASNRARRLLNLQHVTARLEAIEDELNAAIIEQQADNVLDHKEEVRKNLRQLFQVALDKCELEVALKTVVMMGSIDGCANFIHEKATRYETIININFVNGLQEMLRVPGMVDPQGIRELLLKCIDGDGAVSASDPTPRRIAIPGSPERELEVT